MNARCTSDCYCKIDVPIASQREEIRSDRSRGDLASKCSSSKTDLIRGHKTSRKCPMKCPLEERLINSKRSSDESSTTPILSPETSNVLENAKKMIQDARLQIKKIRALPTSRKVRSNAVSYLDDVPIDDDDDHLLYIRERILHKLQEADTRTDGYSQVPKSEIFDERNAHMTAKRIVDLSAPKFRCSARRYEGFTQCGETKISTCGRTMEDAGFKRSSINYVADFSGENDVVQGQTHSPSRELPKEDMTQKIDSLHVQTGPSVNIERKLVAQNLGNLNISPDPSFVEENLNVGTYQFQYDRRGRSNSPIRKEKFVKVTDVQNDANDTAKMTFNKHKTKKSKIVSGSTNYSDSKNGNVTEKLEIHQIENFHPKNEKSSDGSITNEFKALDSDNQRQDSSDVLRDEKNVEHAFDTTNTSTKKVVSDTNTDNVNNVAQGSMDFNAEAPKQCNTEQLPDTSNLRNTTEAANLNNSFNIIQPKISSPQPKMNSPVKSTQQTTREEIANDRGDENIKTKDQQLTDTTKNNAHQEKATLEDYCDCKSLNPELLKCSERSENLDDINLSVPSMDELDNILIGCNKKIDKIVRGTKVIERFLLRPELAEYYSSDDKTSSESILSFDATFIPEEHNAVPRHLNSFHPSAKQIRLSTVHSTHKNQPISISKETHLKKVGLAKIVKPSHGRFSQLVKRNKDDDEIRMCNISKSRLIDRAGSEAIKGFPISRGKQNESYGGIKGPRNDSCANCKSAMKSSSVKRFPERESHAFHVTKADANVTTSSSDPLSSIRDSIEQSIKSSAFKQDSPLRTNIAPSKLDNNSENINLKEVLPRDKNPTGLSDRIVNFVLQDEKQNIESKMTAITPAVLKYFLENLQDAALNANIRDTEPSVPKVIRNFTYKKSQINNDSPGDIQVVAKKNMTSDFKIARFESKENLDKDETISATEKIEKFISSVEIRESITHAESASSSKNNLPDRHQEDKSQLKHESSRNVADGSKIESESESLKEISSMKTDPNSTKSNTENNGIQNSAFPRTEGENREIMSTMLKPIINSNENHPSEQSQATKTIAGHVAEEGIANNNTCSVLANVEIPNGILLIPKNEEKNSKIVDVEILEHGSANSVADRGNFLGSSVRRAENKTEVVEVAGSVIYSPHIPSPCDSLQDCTSLKSSYSSRKDERFSSCGIEICNADTLLVDVNKIDRFEVPNKTANNHINNETSDKSNAPDLVENERAYSCKGNESEDLRLLSKQNCVEAKITTPQFFCSTLNNASPIERSCKSRASISETGKNKTINNEFHVQTSSEVSYSEGELYMPSSCSYSLGEVRVLTNKDTTASMAGDINDAIFVTKSMLTSLNNSTDVSNGTPHHYITRYNVETIITRRRNLEQISNQF